MSDDFARLRRSETTLSKLRLSSVIGAICLALLVGCATPLKVTNPVEERAKERWDAVLTGDFQTAYSYYSPGYRSAKSPVDYEILMRTRRVAWISADVQSVECESNACTVDVKVGYRVGVPLPGVSKWENFSYMKERWVKTGGEWWFLPDD